MKFIFPKVLISLLLLILLMSVVTVIALPYGAVYFLEGQIRKLGVKNVVIGDIDIHYFPGKFILRDLEAVNNDYRKLRVNELVAEFSVDLINKQIMLAHVSVDGLLVHIQQTERGLYTFAVDELPEEGDYVEQAAVNSPADNASAWSVALDRVSLRQAAVVVSSVNAADQLDFKFNLSMTDFWAGASGVMRFGKLEISDFASQANNVSVLSYQSLQVDSLEFENHVLGIRVVSLDNMAVSVLRLESGNLHSLSVINKFLSASSHGVEKDDLNNEVPLVWSLGGFKMSGENTVRIVDQTMTSSSDIEVTLSSMVLGALRSRDPGTATEFSLNARADKYSKIILNGQIWPLLSQPEVQLNSTVEQLNVAPYSSYVREVIGYDITTGQLNLKTQLSIKDKQLNSVNELKINKFTVALADEKKAKAFEKNINLSLDSALYFIRDDNDDIKLTIPVSGAIDDPDFDLASVIREAGGKALQGATVTYLKFALQPWGALFMIGEKINEKAGQIRFEPVEFSAGEAVLKGSVEPYLLKLSELLMSKVKLRLSLCPVTTELDVVALQSAGVAQSGMQAALASLAEQRASVVKDYFVQTKSIEPERLFVCPARQDSEDKIPRVIIEM